MKGILITPDEATIENIDGPFEDFHEIQKAIDCDCFTIAGYFEGHAVFVDDGAVQGEQDVHLDGPLPTTVGGENPDPRDH